MNNEMRALKIKVTYNDGVVIFLEYGESNLAVVKSAFVNGSIRIYDIVKVGV